MISAALRTRARVEPERTAFRFLAYAEGDGIPREIEVSYGELDRRARAVASRVRERTEEGARVLLLLPPGPAYVAAFFGVLYAGRVAVPAYPPRHARGMPRVAAIAASSRASLAVVSGSFGSALPCASLAIEDADVDDDAPVHPATASEVALLQYTSGSTASPKGVRVTHGNLAANSAAIGRAFGTSRDSVGVIWLPPYHDMGLVGGILHPIDQGFPVTLMAPASFLERPMRWLEEIARRRATISGGPDFAYELAVARSTPESRAALDLSSWSTAFSGAEPVRASTLARFAEAFASSGLRRGALVPCYGLAEATLLVTASRRVDGPRTELRARDVVDCGAPLGVDALVVVDPSTRTPVEDGAEGEVWVRGAGVADGYEGAAEATAATFGGVLASEDGAASAARWLRTGDLGFVREGGLFVTGRMKDLLVVRGRNVHPEDVELTAEEASDHVRPHAVAAFETDEGVVVVAELARGSRATREERDPHAVALAIRRAIVEAHDVAVAKVALARLGALPVTSSGKVRRSAARDAFLAGTFGLLHVLGREDVASPADGASDVERLRVEVARILRVAPATLEDDVPFASYGADSLSAIELAGLVAARGGTLSLASVLAGATFRDLVSSSPSPPSPPPPPSSPSRPATWSERVHVARSAESPEATDAHVAVALPASALGGGDLPRLTAAVRAVVARHAALRATFVDEGGLVVRRVAPPDAPQLDEACRVHVRACRQEDLARVLADEAHRPFDLARGPLFRVVRVDALEGDAQATSAVLLAAHHAVMDLRSLELVLDELREPALTRDPDEAPADVVAPASLDFWRGALDGVLPVLELPLRVRRARRPTRPCATVRAEVSGTVVASLRALARGSESTLAAVVLAAYDVVLAHHTGQRERVIGVETSGRTDARVTRAVGSFVNPVAIRSSCDAERPFGAHVRAIRERLLDALAHASTPFPAVVAALGLQVDPSVSPVFQTVFQHYRGPLARLAIGEGDLAVPPRETASELALLAAEVDDRLALAIRFDAQLYEHGTADALLRDLCAVLGSVASGAATTIGALHASLPKARLRVVVAAEQTATPIEPSLRFWLREAGLACDVVHAPYAQVMQELLEPASALRGADVPVVLVRRESLCDPELVRALDGVPDLVVAVAPPAHARSDGEVAPLPRTRARLVDLQVAARAHGLVSPDAVHDVEAGCVADIPFTPSMFAVAGAAVARAVRGLREPRRKVIAVDCDGTLWGGVCGEDGPERVDPTGPYADLQRRLRAEVDAGTLLVTCSKNVASDVRAVFAAHPHMPLRWEDFAAHAIGWDPKPSSLRALAEELGFGLDAFVLVDDSAVERGAVRAACPEVLVVELPEAAADRVTALEHVWDLDHARVTAEDRRRARMAADESARDAVRTQASSLEEFLDGLELVVEVAPLTDGDVPRVAQLTQRTNQLTTTTRRFSEADVLAMGDDVRVVRARDRFGDYGLVGVVAAVLDGPALRVEVFALSCRVLGRRVEHAVLGALAEAAATRGASTLAFPYRLTTRNVPAASLLAALGGTTTAAMGDEGTIAFPTAELGERLPRLGARPAEPAGPRPTPAPREPAPSGVRAQALLDRALELRDPERMLAAIAPAPRRSRGSLPLATQTERALASIWADVLHASDLHADDDFFALGGTSLETALVAAHVRRRLGVELPLGSLFGASVLARAAQAIDALAAAPASLAARTTTRASSSEERLVFLHASSADVAAYNVPVAVRFRAGGVAVDEARLRHALDALARRHAALRTRFVLRHGEAHRIVEEDARVPLDVATESPPDLDAWLGDRARAPFDLGRAPLVRAAVAPDAAGDPVLVVVAHHLVVDGASLAVLAEELATVLRGHALADATEAGLRATDDVTPPAAVAARLAGATATTLPHDEVPGLAPCAARVLREVPSALVAGLRARAHALGTTPNLLLHAAFVATLSRFAGTGDVVSGIVVAGRSPEDRRVGVLVNTVPVRIDLAGDPSCAEIVTRARLATSEALASQHVPFDAIVRVVAPERHDDGTALVASLFVEQDTTRTTRALGAIGAEIVPVTPGAAQTDILLVVARAGDALSLVLERRAERISEALATRFLEHVLHVASAFAGGSHARLSGLSLWTDEERATEARWNATPRDYDLRVTLADLVEAQVDRTPDRIALVFEGVAITYEELDARANAVARDLAARGVSRGDLVGVAIPRSVEMVVALLGVLKRGAAYVPIDPDLPAVRRDVMAERAHSVLSAADVGTARAPREPYPRGARDLAYVMFTSGSTGRPKGVLVEHRGVVNRLAWMQELFPVDEHDAVVQKTPFGFDVSVWELFWPLVTGARLVVARPGGHKDPAYLTALFARERVTVAHFVPSMLRVMVDASGASLGPVRHVFASGEALSPSLLDRVRARWPEVPVTNLYGPTEATIEVTRWTAQARERAAVVPIGAPVPNTYVRLLDAEGRRVPLGAVGELCIGGVQVSRGYLGDDAQTRARFVLDPFSRDPEARLYRTGDLARWRADGQLLFLGRQDDQVKVRGVRIELTEVAGALRAHPDVKDAVVVARGSDGDAHLVAYVVVDGHPTELRAFLAERLPDAMIPRHVVALAALPIGPTGKLDRAALPDPVAQVDASGADDVGAGPAEAILAPIWSRALGVRAVPRDRSFFALGGDSILALRVVGLANEAGLALTVRDLVRHPTLAGLAAAARVRDALAPAVDVSDGAVALTPLAEAFLARGLPNPHHWNQSVHVVLDEGALDADALGRALDGIVATHEALRLRIDLASGRARVVARGVPEATLPLRIVPKTGLEDAVVAAQRTLHLEEGPIARAVATGDGDIVLVAHHVAVDAVSWRILVRDLLAAYRAATRGRGTDLGIAPVPVPLGTWAASVGGSGVDEPRDAPPLPAALAWARRSPDLVEGRAARLHTTATATATRRLAEDLARLADASLEDALLSALARAVDHRGLLVDREGHGRGGGDLSRTVGWLTALSELALDVDAGTSVLDAVMEARRARLAAAHTEDSRRARRAPVSFDFLGVIDVADAELGARVVSTSSPADRDASAPRTHALEVVARVEGGALVVEWRHPEEATAAVASLAARTMDCLRRLAEILREESDVCEEAYPLTGAQAGIVFESVAGARPGLYVEQVAFAVDAPLDVAALRAATRAVVARHAALRTSFARSRQRVARLDDLAEAFAVEGHVHDDAALDAFLDADRARGFDVAVAPLFRVTWVTYGALVVTHHHAVLDGWSLPIVLRDLFASYRGEALGPPPPPFRDYLGWLAARDHGAAERAWRTRLAGAPRTEIPFARLERVAGEPSSGRAERSIVLSPQLAARIAAGAAQAGVSLATFATGALALLLARATDAASVTFARTVAGRPGELPGAEAMVGALLATLPFTVDVEAHADAASFLRAVAEDASRDEEHGFSGLEGILRATGAAAPKTLFVFESYPTGAPPAFVRKARSRRDLEVPLVVALTPRGGSSALLAEVLYDRAHVSEAAAAATLEQLVHVLGALADAASRAAPLADVALTGGERSSSARVGTGDARPLHVRVLEAALLAPDAIAVVPGDGGASLTYAGLAESASRVARALVAAGVRRGDVVGVHAGTSPAFVRAVLGVLSAGAAYLPLDPTLPPARLDRLVRDAQLAVVLTDEERAPKAITPLSIATADGPHCLLPEVSQEDLAYVLFTSGSTGEPKAVACAHRGAMNLLDDLDERAPGFARASTWTRVGFDVSVYEIFSALARGATLHVVPEARRTDPDALLDWIATSGIESAYVPGFALPALAARVEAGFAVPLRRVLVGVEPIDGALVARILARCPSLSIVNGYGPTEASICATLHAASPDSGGRLPIGRAVRGARVELRDRDGRRVPPGVPGEVVVSGEGLARGYLHRPDLTASSFGGGVYRTGDRAFATAAGELVFVGRTDDQLKLNGVRVEPREVEAILEAHPSVSAAAVLPSTRRPGVLVAFVSLTSAVDRVDEALRAHARGLLPLAAVPGVVVVVDTLPRDANGKLDRVSLAALEPYDEPARRGGPPLGPHEEIVAGLFTDVLGVPPVSREDDFFALGGHSLLASRVVARLRDVAGVEVPVRALFEEPTVRGFARAALGGARAASTDDASILPLAEGEEPALSFAQERLWFVEQLEPGTAAYNLPCAVRIRRAVDDAALVRALVEIVRRHEPLRTTIRAEGGRPVQRIVPDIAPPFARVDLRHLPEARRLTVALEEATREAESPFDLALAPLLRARLFVLGDDDNVLVMTMHHIAGDGWSLAVLVRELTALYEGYRAGREPALPAPPIRYRDFAAWQRRRLSGPRLDALVRAWSERLLPLPGRLDLPFDHAPRGDHARGGRIAFELSASVAEGVESLSRRLGATPFMTLLAALDVVLARVSGGDDVAVGASFANRDRSEIEPLVGFFVNLVVVRVDMREASTFEEVVAEVRRVALDAYANQEMPFDRLVDELRVPRVLGETPLFQVNFVYQSASPELPDGFEPVVLETNGARFDLALSVERTRRGYAGTLEWRASRFERATAARLLGFFTRFLDAAIAAPARPWRELSLGDGAALAPAPPAEPGLVHELVERTATRHPERVALRVHGERACEVTYGDLDLRANRLAHVLRARGVGRESRVGLAFPRTASAIVAMLAITKAGGAWVPLDPTYPAERLAAVVEDAELAVVLASDAAAELLPSSARVLVLEELASALAAAPSARPEPLPGTSPRDLAYVLYTSGSTGVPNGVCIEHAGVVNLALAQREAFGVRGDDVVLQFAPLAFDASVSEVFVTLAAGAVLDLGLDDARRDLPDALANVTMATLPPSVLAALDVERYPALRTLVVAGEACPPDLARRWARGRRMLNAYGPTEATVCATVCDVGDDLVARLPIGRPIRGVGVAIVDGAGRPVPVGIVGELVVSGAGVMRGYWRRPELDAARLVSGAYRTGDLGRLRADGVIELFGRIDAQIKHRGIRIEPGEVEVALRAHPAVVDAVVDVRDDRLVAWLSAEDVDDDALAAHVGRVLPPHLVPSSFVRVASFPRTPSGKLDRRALPSPARANPTDPAPHVAPASDPEIALAALWSELLGAPRPSLADNFFALGGDSIASVQLVARARRRGLAFTVKDVFAHQTLAELARIARPLSEVAPVAVPLDGTPFPLSPVQRWFFDEYDSREHYNQSVLLELEVTLEEMQVRDAWARVLRHHDALRLRFSRHGGDGPFEQRYVDDDAPVVVRHDLAPVPDEELTSAIEARADAAQRGFDLELGPLARVVLFDVGPGRPQRLLFVVHHLLVDAFSLRWVVEDFFLAASAIARGEEPRFDAKTASYRAFCESRAREAADPRFSAERAFWAAQRSGPHAALAPATDPERATRASFELDAVETDELLAHARSSLAMDPQELLLAAMSVAFAPWARGSLLVDVEGHGREGDDTVDVSRTVGWFTAVYPVRLDAAARSEAETLAAVKSAVRGAPRGGIGAGFDGPRAPIAVNYLGRLDRALGRAAVPARMAKERVGSERGSARRPHALEVQAFVLDGRLRVHLDAPSGAPAAAWADDIARALRGLLRAGAAEPMRARAPIEFPEADLSADELAHVLDELAASGAT